MTHSFTDLVDLAADRLGGVIVAANDEFFAPTEGLLRSTAAVWKEGEYTEHGKWMDGWETRRRRTPGHDWCIIRLGAPGIVRGVVVDTSFFRGNYPEHCSIEACDVEGTPTPEVLAGPETTWTEILPRSPLTGDARNERAVEHPRLVTHLRFNIFPDGGVARLRVHGEVAPNPRRLLRAEVDLAAMENGAFVETCSDMFFGHRQNLILPGRSTHMGDGWETKRRRGPGHDWTIVRLAAPGIIHRIEVDTDHFKGNAPESCSLDGCPATDATTAHLASPGQQWWVLLPRTRLQPHTRHVFDAELHPPGPVTHVRLNIFPDGGVARLRLLGTPAR